MGLVREFLYYFKADPAAASGRPPARQPPEVTGALASPSHQVEPKQSRPCHVARAGQQHGSWPLQYAARQPCFGC
jgi:hypothetical protein